MKKILAIIIYCILFTALLFVLSPVFVPKWRSAEDNHMGSIVRGYYDEKKDSLDVLFLGNSDMYRGVLPIELWDNYGIASYIYTTPGQRTWTGYYILEDALLYQHPKLIVYNVDSINKSNQSQEANYRKSFDNMKLTTNKINAITDKRFEFKLEDKADYIFPILRFHDRWRELTEDDFKYAYNEHFSYKGYDLIATTKPSTIGDTYMEDKNETFEMVDYVEEYLDKIVERCKEENIKLLLVEIPTTDSWDLARSKTISEYAKKNNLTFLDLNLHLEEMNFDWYNDTPDAGDHLNIYGAEKVSKYLGDYLKANYEIPDRRNDEAYSQWNEDSKIFHKDVEDAKREAQNN
jgi:hypothetical protein